MSAGKCKRVAPEGPLLATSSSSSSDDDSPRQPPITSPGSASSAALSPSSTSLQGIDPASETASLSPIGRCSSPGGSSTASSACGVGRVRYPSHRGEVRRPRSKKKRNEDGENDHSSRHHDNSTSSDSGGAYVLQRSSFPDQKTTNYKPDKHQTAVKSRNFEGEKEEVDAGKRKSDAEGLSVNQESVKTDSSTECGMPLVVDGKAFQITGKGLDRNRSLGRKLSCSGGSLVSFSEKTGSAGEGKGKGLGHKMSSGGGQKVKPARAPMPMRQRALPPSFWQQPNVPQNAAPGSMYSILPPLFNQDSSGVTDVRPVTPPDELEDEIPENSRTTIQGSEGEPRVRNPLLQTAPAALVMAQGPGLTPRSRKFSRGQPEMSITVTNTDLLQKLFECVIKDSSAATSKQKNSCTTAQLRRIRSRKLTVPASSDSASQLGVGGAKQLLSGRHDPYLVDNIADKLFPQLSLEAGRGARPMGTGGGAYGGHSTLQLVSVREGDNVLSLPALTNDQNYGAMLNELVAHI